MSKRVYEIARELNLENKEVIGRLNDAGVEVKSHSSSVDEPDYERVFGTASDGGVAPNGRTEAQEEEAQETREEAEHSGHNATIAAAPAEEPISEPKQGRPPKKRRRVVIDASARNRGTRMSTPVPQREPERAPSEAKKPDSDAVRVEPGATVKDLGEAIGVPPTQIIKVLMGLGEMKTLTQTLSTEEVELIAEELGVEVEIGAVEEPAPADVAPDDATRRSLRCAPVEPG
jgi:translation initiation factor IF-2